MGGAERVVAARWREGALISLSLLGVELLLLGGIALWLHWISSRYGLAPLLIFLAGAVSILHAMGNAPVFVQAPGTLGVVATDVVLVPVILLVLMVLYEVDGTATARVTIASVLGVSGFTLAMQLLRQWHLALPGGSNTLGLATDHAIFTRSPLVTVSSLTAFAAGSLAMVVVYQASRNHLPPRLRWLIPGIALFAGLMVDSLVFRYFAFGWTSFANTFWATAASKSVGALIMWPCATVYLSRTPRRYSGHEQDDERGTLDLVFGSYAKQEAVLQRTEARRQEVEKKLEAVVSKIPSVFFALDRDGVFTLAEGAGLAAMALDPEQVVGRQVWEVLPEMAGDVRRALAGDHFAGTQQIGDRFYETTYTPQIGDDGAVVGIAGVAMDHTERLHARQALQDSEERFRHTFEQAAVGIAHADTDGRFSRFNQIFLDILGYDERDLFDLTVQALIHPDDREANARQAREVIRGHASTYTAERRFVQKSGSIVWTMITVSLVRDAEGEPDYFIAIVEEITDRRAMEQQLRQAQKMEAVGQLAAGVAHDFNNLLTVIGGNGELIRDGLAGDDPMREDVESICKAAGSAAMLTRQLLAFSRQQVLQPRVLAMSEAVHELEPILRTILGESIEMTIAHAPDCGRVQIDPGQLEQVIVNLVMNARDAMPTGGEVTIGMNDIVIEESDARETLGLEAGSYVQLAIRDVGVGMDERTRSRIFEPFFTTKEPGKGTGLGLASAYGIVKQSGGSIEAHSVQEQGTTFTIYLPRVDEAAFVEDTGDRRPAVATGAETILLVEDDPGVRSLALRVLRRQGYTVLEAGDGEEAVLLCDRHDGRIDLVLSDVVMPRLSGPKAMEQILEMRAGVQVVYMSGYTDDATGPHGVLAEDVHFVQKPFTPAALVEKVREALDLVGAPMSDSG